MEDNLPIGPQEWEDMTEAHNSNFLQKNRDSQSLRRKFNEFVNSKKPTGDPHCPPHIRRAKLIQRMIISKSDSGGGMLNDEDLAFGDDEEDAPLVEPQNLLPALDNITTTSETTPLENATVSIRSMVTPRRRIDSGHSSGSNIGSLLDVMVANMMERQQIEARQREERRREHEVLQREREEQHQQRREELQQHREELQQEREERREERKAEQEERRAQQQAQQEERRLDRAQQQALQQQQTMLMMLAFGARKNTREGGAPGRGEGEGLFGPD